MASGWLPPTGAGWVRAFGFFKTHRGWALLIALVNLVGIAYGFYYYLPQFAATPWWWWAFVPDSPLAVLWAELALLAHWWGRRPGVLDALAVVGNLQVGLWTCYVLLAYEERFHTLDVLQGEGPLHLNTVLWVGHLAMAALALVFLDGLRARARVAPRAVGLAMGLAAAYYLVQDALDYWGPSYLGTACGLRPHTVPCEAAVEPTLALVTVGLTCASVAFLAAVARRGPRESNRGRE